MDNATGETCNCPTCGRPPAKPFRKVGRPKGAKDSAPRKPKGPPREKRSPKDYRYQGKSPFDAPLRRGRKNTKIGTDYLPYCYTTLLCWSHQFTGWEIQTQRLKLRIVMALWAAQEYNHGKPAPRKLLGQLYSPSGKYSGDHAGQVAVRYPDLITRPKRGYYMLTPLGIAHANKVHNAIADFHRTMETVRHQTPNHLPPLPVFMANAALYMRHIADRNNPRKSRT